MLRAFTLAVGQLGDRAILRVLAKSLLVTMAIFLALGAIGGWALAGYDPCAAFDDGGGCPLGAGAGGFGALVLTLAALWLLFPAVAIGVVCAYMDEVIRAVEARHYPDALATARPLGWAGAAWLGLRSSLRVALYNLVALPLYVILLVTGVGTILLFVVVNGAAFGRDLGEMVARRHLHAGAARDWLRTTRGTRVVLGMGVTGLFLVPVANLLAPVIAAATATHVFHESEGRRRRTG